MEDLSFSPNSEASRVLTLSWICAFWSEHVGAAAGCRCRAVLEGAAVRVVCALSRWPTGAAAGCCFRVLLFRMVCVCVCVGVCGCVCVCVSVCVRFGAGLLVPLQAVCALEGACCAAGYYCYYCQRAMLLQGTAVRVRCAL